MSTGKSELFTFIGAAFGTAAALFGAQTLYGVCLDLRFHAEKNAALESEVAVATRKSELQKLAAGKLPLEQAKQLLAERGRDGFGSVAARPSDDLSAVSGWIHHPNFKPVVAHPIRTPRVIAPEPVAAPLAPVAAPTPTPAAQPAAARRH
ncbi:MAG TPA: hypothetical protein VF331_23225 [Polyangiales bacterium]